MSHRIDAYSPRFIARRFRVHRMEDLDQDVQDWLCEAYRVGAQQRSSE
jgi:hypothetical protein